MFCWFQQQRTLLSAALQAVVVSAGGRLTVALYTIRHVAPGEELTFDYASVTESEDEFKQAFCMCSTRQCRGSYLHYTGKAYMQVMDWLKGAGACCFVLLLFVAAECEHWCCAVLSQQQCWGGGGVD